MALAACLAIAAIWVGPAAAAVSGVRMTATINGRDTKTITSNNPLRLRPEQNPDVKVSAFNGTDHPVNVRSVRIDGKAMDLTFYTFSTEVDLVLAPGQSGEREFTIDLMDLGGQATGLLPSRLSLLDPHRQIIASHSFPADVRGSLRSVYGIFGIAVAGITACLLAAVLVRLVTHRLPANRWTRAVRFAIPGIGIGLSLTFTLSVFRVFSPDPNKWLTLTAAGALIGFVIGYLTPGPPRPDEDEDEADFVNASRLAGAGGAGLGPRL